MDIELYFEKSGEGEPFVLLHGNGEDSSYFVNQIEYFKDKYQMIAVDTRGHGKSPRGTKPFTISQFADDLYDFLSLHQIEKANILGFSDGANIAMQFAVRYPDKVNRLILNGGNLNSKGVRVKYQLPIELVYRISRLFKNEKSKEMLSLMVNSPNIAVDELHKINKKTLVIAGDRDMIKRSHTKLIAQNIKNSKLVFLPGNHFIAKNNANEFNNAVEDFLEEKKK